jgi:putative methyltransferase (TIGR04325 family)
MGAAGRTPLRSVAIAAYERYFRTSGRVRLFRGVYPDFAAALASAPKQSPTGYNHAYAAALLVNERQRIISCDYPVLFWLSSLLQTHRFVFDLGGHIGISYYAFQRAMSYPGGLTWLVSDLPEITALGKQIAAEERDGAPGLRFTNDCEELAKADILLALGSLQFIEDPFAHFAKGRPAHLIINKTPVYDQPSAATLQCLGSGFCANHLFNREQFLERLGGFGYQLIDSWTNSELDCTIPFFSRSGIRAYSGFYLRQVH